MSNSKVSAVMVKQVVVVVVVGRQEMDFLKSNNCCSQIEHVTSL
jgi:hypothetical protein